MHPFFVPTILSNTAVELSFVYLFCALLLRGVPLFCLLISRPFLRFLLTSATLSATLAIFAVSAISPKTGITPSASSPADVKSPLAIRRELLLNLQKCPAPGLKTSQLKSCLTHLNLHHKYFRNSLRHLLILQKYLFQ